MGYPHALGRITFALFTVPPVLRSGRSAVSPRRRNQGGLRGLPRQVAPAYDWRASEAGGISGAEPVDGTVEPGPQLAGMSKYPWSVALAGYLIGAYLLPSSASAYRAAEAVLVVTLFLWYCGQRQAWAGMFLAAVAWALFGQQISYLEQRRVPPLVFPVGDFLLGEIEGIVATLPVRLPGHLQGSGTRGPDGQSGARSVVRFELAELRIGARPVAGRLVVYVDSTNVDVAPGDRVHVLARLEPLSHAGNPGSPCSGCLQQRRGVVAIAQLPTHKLLVIRQVAAGGPLYWPLRVGHRVNERLRQQLSPEVYPVAAALLTGEYRQIPRFLMRQIQVAGLMHLLAISGLHFGILAAMTWWLLRLFCVPVRLSALAVAGISIFFCAMTGARPSAVRATVLILVHLAGLLVSRPGRRFNNLSFAALVVLVRHPWDLFNPGFQLSFLSVAVMYWVIPPALAWAERCLFPSSPLFYVGRGAAFRAILMLSRWTVRSVLVSAVLMLVLGPVTASHFGYAPFAGVLLTCVCLPPVAVGLMLLLAGVAFPGTPGNAFLSLADSVFWSLLALVDLSSSWHARLALRWEAAVVLATLVAAACGGVSMLVIGRQRKLKPRKVLVSLLLMAVVAVGTSGCRHNSASLDAEGVQVTVLNVGHGLCVLGKAGEDVFVYDAGSMGGPDVVARAFEGARREFHIDDVALLFLSHADADHLNAIEVLLERVGVRQVITSPGVLDPERGVLWVLQLFQERGIPVRAATRGDVFEFSSRVRLRVLHPPDHRHYATDNEGSLVLLVEAFGSSLLLAGDLEAWGLEDFLHEGFPGPVDVLVAPHHGAQAANPPRLYDRLRPRAVVASATRRWGYPLPLEHLSRADRRVFVTAVSGAVTWRAGPCADAEVGTWVHSRVVWESLPLRR